MSQQRKYHSMKCPDCGSHNTQSVSVAHSQSVRTSANGYQSISEFGKGLEPPPPRSEFAIPLGVAYVVGFLVFVSVSDLAACIGVWWPTVATWIDMHPFIFSVSVALFAGLLVSSSAIGFNIGAYRIQMDNWSQGVVCRRCGHRFSQ